MTHEQRITALETILARYEAFFYFGHSVENDPYVMTRGGFHICTNFHANAPRAQGALFSCATDVHKWALYIAKDVNNASPNVPGPVIYIENVRPGESNWGIQMEIANARENIGLWSNVQHSVGGMFPGRSTALVMGDGRNVGYVTMGLQGICMVGDVVTFHIVRAVGAVWSAIKQIWP